MKRPEAVKSLAGAGLGGFALDAPTQLQGQDAWISITAHVGEPRLSLLRWSLMQSDVRTGTMLAATLVEDNRDIIKDRLAVHTWNSALWIELAVYRTNF